MTKVGQSLNISENAMAELRSLTTDKRINTIAPVTDSKPKQISFAEHLLDSIKETNNTQKTADKAATDLSTGKEQNIHETMLAATEAELSFNLMVQIRNKALAAYQEIMRMPV